MRIRMQDFPILNRDIEKMQFELIGDQDGLSEDEINEMAYEIAKDTFSDKRTKVLLFSEKFVLAALKAAPKLISLYKQIKPGKYIILKASREIGEPAYVVEMEDWSLYILECTHNNVFNYCQQDVTNSGGDLTLAKLNEIIPDSHPEDDDFVIKFDVGTLYDPFPLIALLFYQFADIETLILNEKCKRGHLNNCKYLLECDSKITIVDSTWFTTIIQSEGFKVRGHFAFRAFGEGHSQRRLVWISEFNKNGYTRKAGILNHSE